jgi:hypothetical protein
MLNFLHFTRKILNVKLIKIKLDLLINYQGSKLGLADRNNGIMAVDILVFVEIISKVTKIHYFIYIYNDLPFSKYLLIILSVT